MKKDLAKKCLIKHLILTLFLSFSALAEDRVVVDTYSWESGAKFNSIVVYRSQNRFDAVLSIANSDLQKILSIPSTQLSVSKEFFFAELRSEYESILMSKSVNSVLNAGYKGYELMGEPVWTFQDRPLLPGSFDSRENTVAVSFLGLDLSHQANDGLGKISFQKYVEQTSAEQTSAEQTSNIAADSSAQSNPSAVFSVSRLKVSVPGVKTLLDWGLLSDGVPTDIRCLKSVTQGSPNIVKGPHQSRSCSVQFSIEDQQKRVWPGSFVASASYSRSDQFSETRSIGPGAATAVFTAGVGNAVWALVNSISNEGKAGATVRAVRAACIAQQELLAQIPRCSND